MTDILLAACAILMIVALLQAVAGILFFRPLAALWIFFLQSLSLFAGAVLVWGFTFRLRFVCGWIGVALFLYLLLLGFREWQVKGIRRLPPLSLQRPGSGASPADNERRS